LGALTLRFFWLAAAAFGALGVGAAHGFAAAFGAAFLRGFLLVGTSVEDDNAPLALDLAFPPPLPLPLPLACVG